MREKFADPLAPQIDALPEVLAARIKRLPSIVKAATRFFPMRTISPPSKQSIKPTRHITFQENSNSRMNPDSNIKSKNPSDM